MRKLMAIFAGAATAAAATVSALVAPPALAAALPANSGQFALRLSGAQMAGPSTITQSDAVALATRYDYIITNNRKLTNFVPAMRAANPALKILVYLNGTYDTSPTPDSFPDSWYAHDANGNKVRAVHDDNWLMDVGNPAWVANRAQECHDWTVSNLADGCYLDMLGSASIMSNYVSALPINPRTGQAWTTSDFLHATAAIVTAARAANAGRLVTGNGLGGGDRYFTADPNDSSGVLVTDADAIQAETWLRSGNDPLTKYRSEDSWRRDVDMLVDLGRKGESALVSVKTYVPGTDDQKAQWESYAFATFLLGSDGHSAFQFAQDQSWSALTRPVPWESTAVGTPVTSYVGGSGAMYQRSFTNALVVANPTTSAEALPLAGSYVDLRGSAHTGSLVLQPHTGDVLTPQTAAGAPVAVLGAPSVQARSATVAGAVNPAGGSTTYWFEYGPTTSYGSATAATTVPAGLAQVPATASLSGLAPGSTLHVRLVAQNASGQVATPDQTVQTLPLPPAVTQEAVGSVGAATAALSGMVDTGNAATQWSVQYGATKSYGHSTPAVTLPAGAAPVGVLGTLSGLTPLTRYHARLVATNSAGTGYGPDLVLNTTPLAPSVQVAPASSVTATGAVGHGSVNPQQGRTTYHFEYGTTTAYGASTSSRSLAAGSQPVSVTASLTGLAGASTYHLRLVASNAGGTTASPDVTFTTVAAAPTAVTKGSSAVSSSGATVSGAVNGSGQATSYRFEWGRTSGYGNATAWVPLSAAGGTAAVTAQLTGLSAGSVYHYRVVAQNATGTTAGSDRSFKTS